MFALHVNSNFFWMFKSLLGVSTQGALKTLTVATSLGSLVSLPFVLLLSRAVKREPQTLVKVAYWILAIRLVDLAGSLYDLTVRWDAATGAHKDGRPDRKTFRRHLAQLAISFEERHLRHEGGETLNAGPRATGRQPFQHFADEEQENDGRRLLVSPDEYSADGGDAHERFD